MGGRGEWDQKGMCGKNIQSATLEGCYFVTGVRIGASDSKRRFIPVEDSTFLDSRHRYGALTYDLTD